VPLVNSKLSLLQQLRLLRQPPKARPAPKLASQFPFRDPFRTSRFLPRSWSLRASKCRCLASRSQRSRFPSRRKNPLLRRSSRSYRHRLRPFRPQSSRRLSFLLHHQLPCHHTSYQRPHHPNPNRLNLGPQRPQRRCRLPGQSQRLRLCLPKLFRRRQFRTRQRCRRLRRHQFLLPRPRASRQRHPSPRCAFQRQSLLASSV